MLADRVFRMLPWYCFLSLPSSLVLPCLHLRSFIYSGLVEKYQISIDAKLNLILLRLLFIRVLKSLLPRAEYACKREQSFKQIQIKFMFIVILETRYEEDIAISGFALYVFILVDACCVDLTFSLVAFLI